jgi:hypothetical protein
MFPWNLLSKLDSLKRSGVAIYCGFDIHAPVILCLLKLAWGFHEATVNMPLDILSKRKEQKRIEKQTLLPWHMVPILSVRHIELKMHPGQRNCTSNPSSKRKNNIRHTKMTYIIANYIH